MPGGARKPLSPVRRLCVEYLHHAVRVPSLPDVLHADLSEVAEARARAAEPVSWTAVFLRAYGLAGRDHPALRTALVRYPWPHLYEHRHTVASVLVEREVGGECVTLAAKVRAPEDQSLRQIHAHLQRLKGAPVEQVSDFRQLLRLARAPWPLQRLAFWHTLHWSGRRRAERFGTCLVSSLGKYGVEQINPLTVLTTYFTAGPVEPGSRTSLRIVYDHRVMDSGHVARALVGFNEALQTTILRELKALACQRRAA
jgi:hypothetical protein